MLAGFAEGSARGRRGGPADPGRHAAHRDAARGPVAGDRRAGRPATGTPGWSASTSPAPRRASRPPGTWTPSSTCSGRTSTSPSTPARRSGCRRSGRRSSGAGRTGSATGCGSSTTSPPARADARPAGRVRAGQADPAGAVPVVERADRGGGVDRRPPDRAAARPAVPGHRQHRQPADERHLDVAGDGAAGARPSATAGRSCSGSPINAMKSAFIPFDERLAIIDEVIKPAYAKLLA